MIRAVKREELQLCVDVIKESFLTVAEDLGFTEENAPRFTAFATNLERLQTQFREKRPMFVCVNAQDKIVGYYSLYLQENQECELNNLCVLPQYRHLKIGEELLAHAFETALTLGCRRMHIGIVEENRILRAWYEKYGAVHTGTQKFDFFPFACGYMVRDL